MKREIITPDSKEHWLELRTKDITSTEVSALFGLSPYTTEFELWHAKLKGGIQEFVQTERMAWGNRLEEAIARGIAEDEGLDIVPMKNYYRLPVAQMGSSFDFRVLGGGIFEIKNVDSLVFRDKWEVIGDQVLMPAHIEMQVQHQMAVSGYEWAKIGVLVGGNKTYVIHRNRNEVVIQNIFKRVGEFWASVCLGSAPVPNYERDAAAIARLKSYAEPDKTIEVDGSEWEHLATCYKEASLDEKNAKNRKNAVKAEMLMKIDNAEKVKGPGFSISAGMREETEVSYTRKAFRDFRVHWKKDK